MSWEIENPDFTKLTALVDSVKTSSPELLYWYFLKQKNYGPLHYRLTIKLVNTREKELEIQSDDFNSDGFYCPWEMKLNNLHSANTAAEIRRFIQNVYPDFLRKEERVALIQGLVKLLYLQWEKTE